MNNGVLSHSEKNSECYSYLHLPLTYNGKKENWHLLLYDMQIYYRDVS